MTEPAQMTWDCFRSDIRADDLAREIVAWVERNGGSARFVPDPTTCEGESCSVDHGGDVIEVFGTAVAGSTVWPIAYLEWGDTIRLVAPGVFVIDPPDSEKIEGKA